MMETLHDNLTPEGRMLLRRAFQVREEAEKKAKIADDVVSRICVRAMSLGKTGEKEEEDDKNTNMEFSAEEKEVLGFNDNE